MGSITNRKGVGALVRAFCDASLGENVRLLIAGDIDAPVKDLLATAYEDPIRTGQLIVIDRFLTSREFWLTFRATDVVCAPYVNHVGSSGIVACAAYAERPVLASDFGWVGEATRRYELGIAVDVSDHVAFVKGIKEMIHGIDSFVPSLRSAVLVDFNTPTRFKNQVTSALDERVPDR